MLTPSVNIVQSSFPEQLQGEISGLSRSISNLGSSFGTAIAGTILVSDLASGNTSYVLAMVVLAVIALIGLARRRSPAEQSRAGRAQRVGDARSGPGARIGGGWDRQCTSALSAISSAPISATPTACMTETSTPAPDRRAPAKP
jgi:hypothetical protein